MRNTTFLGFLLIVSIGIINAQDVKFTWAHGIGGTDWGDAGKSITIDASGYVYSTGNYQGTVDFDPSNAVSNLTSVAGTPDIFIQKLDPAGNLVWAKSMGGDDFDRAEFITVDVYGNIYTTGIFRNTADFDPGSATYNLTSVGDYDIFIQKLDAAGNFLWAKSMGGTAEDYGQSICIDVSGNVYTVGRFSDTVDFDPGSATYNLVSAGIDDIFIQKLDATGNFVWAKRMGGNSYDRGLSVAIDDLNNIYTTGFYRGTVDFDPNGGTYNLSSLANNDDIFIQKLDSAGNFIWAKSSGNYGIKDNAHSITIDNSSNLYITGEGSGSIQKLDSAGNTIWLKTMSDDFVGNSLVVDDSAYVYTTGYYSGTVDFDPGAGTYNLTSQTTYGHDVFIQKLDSAGNFIWAKSMGGNDHDEGNSIAVDYLGNICTIGIFESTADMDPGNGTYNLISAGSNDIFIQRLRPEKPVSFTVSSNNLTAAPFYVSFTNTSVGYSSYSWNFGDGKMSIDTNTNNTYLYNGTYQVILFATDSASGITDTAMATIVCSGGSNNPCGFPSEITNKENYAIICEGDSIRLSANSEPNVTYAWALNGMFIQGATDSILYAKDQGIYMAVLSNGSCSRLTSNYYALGNYPNITPTITVTGSIAPCSNDSVKLEVSPNNLTYSWNNGNIGQSVYVKNSGRYVANGIDANGCSNISAEEIINVSVADIPKICVVTVDSVNNHAIVKWQASTTQKIDSFRVYRESNITNVYNQIGSVAYSDPLQVEDVNSNVAVRQYSYKITAIDTCGKETPVSLKHKTIHLMVNHGLNNHWNLIWRPYEGFKFASYNIYRGTDSLNMSLLTTLSSSITSYTDLTNPSGDIYYQIEIVSTDPCQAKSFAVSRSNCFNTKHASGVGFISVSKNTAVKLSLFPNPNNGRFTLTIENATAKSNEKYIVEVYDVTGNLLHSQNINGGTTIKKSIQLQRLSKGMYFLILKSKNNLLTTRFVVQ